MSSKEELKKEYSRNIMGEYIKLGKAVEKMNPEEDPIGVMNKITGFIEKVFADGYDAGIKALKLTQN